MSTVIPMYFLNNTHIIESGATRWEAFTYRKDALAHAQHLIDWQDAAGEIWIEDGKICVSSLARLDWSLKIYDDIEAALTAIENYNDPALEIAAIRAAAQKHASMLAARAVSE